MKKLIKIVSVAAMCVALSFCVFAFVGCSKAKTYEGEYLHTNWGTDYGVKVKVTVQKKLILKVEIVESDYVLVTPSWEDKATWENGYEELLKSYEGKTVSEVLAMTVEDDSAGQDLDLIATGATMSSARILLAVQDAIKKV